ncbi:TRAP transporter large permease subunit [Oceanimonas sp. NS1]|nr:TRAP transporter large permease subunit [Oceanimonas sp. NS1]
MAYVALIGLFTKQLSWHRLWSALVETARLTSAVFLIMAASAVVSWLLSYAQVPKAFVTLFDPIIEQPVLVLLLLSLITFATGMFMEEVSALMLLTPSSCP